MNPEFLSTLTPTQLAGERILALLAYREKSDLSYQHSCMGFLGQQESK